MGHPVLLGVLLYRTHIPEGGMLGRVRLTVEPLPGHMLAG